MVSLQLQRVRVPADFEAAMMSSVITRISILEAARFKARREVQFRTRALTARYQAVQLVALARGAAGRAAQRGRANAAKLAATVSREMEAFGNVSAADALTPHQVLDYAYWQLVVGDTAPGLRQRLPLHDMLIGGK